MRAQVLIGPLDVPWITDFGLSTSANMTSMSQSSAGGRGTLPFRGPELFSYPPVVSQAADVYAYGILAWCVVAGEAPYANMESAATSLPTAVDEGIRPTLASGDDWRDRTTNSLSKLIEACWDGRAASRPTFMGASGIVATLDKMEASMSKASDEDAQLMAVKRLVASESEAQAARAYVTKLRVAKQGATESEANELKEEEEGAEVAGALVEQHAEKTKEAIAKMPGGDKMLQEVLAMMAEMKDAVSKLSQEVEAHDMSLSSLTVGELDVPRLVIFLPVQPPASRLKRLLHRATGFVKDRYRLIFLDPVSGNATPTGPDGTGYQVEMPVKWLAEHARALNDGFKVAKVALAAGRMLGLPVDVHGLPNEVVSAAEMQALRSFEVICSTSTGVALDTANESGNENAKKAKAVTGKSYKALRQMINAQCRDMELQYCGMKKVRANDGTIEFIAPESVDKFREEGKACQVWNQLETASTLEEANLKA